ncbi:MAG: MFS transporter [Gemmatimonadaceae bacterium]
MTIRSAPSAPPAGGGARRTLSRGSAIRFVVFLGVVSLFADMTYEGGRSITGPYLELLGASATVVGVVAGFGELLGYGLRLVSGYLSDRTGRYWTITLVGYAVNVLAVPALALTGNWPAAVALMMLERTGKAIRKPARDAMLAHATSEMGRGWGFGLHEAMDQTGALIGPLIVALVLHARGGHYRAAFAVLVVPALLAVTVLLMARAQYPRPADLEVKHAGFQARGVPHTFWMYAVGSALIAAGYADFPLIAYHFAKASIVTPTVIPILYAVAMGTAGITALAAGRLYDRVGLPVLIGAAALAAAFAPLVFLGGVTLAVAGMVLWGIGMGVQDSILRAALAAMVAADRRAGAYGVFDTVFGGAWFLGSALMGVLYDHSRLALVGFSVVAQLAALPVLFVVARQMRRTHAPESR